MGGLVHKKSHSIALVNPPLYQRSLGKRGKRANFDQQNYSWHGALNRSNRKESHAGLEIPHPQLARRETLKTTNPLLS